MKDKSPRITLCSIKNYCLSFLFPVFFFIFLSFSLSFFLSPLHISSVSKSARMSRSSFTASQAALARAHNCLFTLMSWNCSKQNKDDTAHFERVTETKTNNTSGHLSCSLLLFYSPPQGSENAAQLAKHTCVLHVKPLNKVYVTNFKQMNYPRVSFPNPSHTRILRRVSSVHLCNSKHHQKKNTNQFFVHVDRLYSALTGFSHRLLGSAKSVLWRAERWCTIACNSNL